MKMFTFLAFTLSLLGCGRTSESIIQKILLPKEMSSVNETAPVEKVFSAKEKGFSYISYQVTWHGQQIIVPDTIHSTNFKVGDKLTFMVMKQDLSRKGETNGTKVLAFQAFP